jgi:hypothetical protein
MVCLCKEVVTGSVGPDNAYLCAFVEVEIQVFEQNSAAVQFLCDTTGSCQLKVSSERVVSPSVRPYPFKK